jgi:hypothetical protein
MRNESHRGGLGDVPLKTALRVLVVWDTVLAMAQKAAGATRLSTTLARGGMYGVP